MSWTNLDSAHRHSAHALEDFKKLRDMVRDRRAASLLHSLSHHLRHAVYRVGEELPPHHWREIPERDQ
jgi:hypothetical protein